MSKPEKIFFTVSPIWLIEEKFIVNRRSHKADFWEPYEANDSNWGLIAKAANDNHDGLIIRVRNEED